ncbi:hypothetical protein [Ruminococcus sp.]|uniref:P-loop ATPase, Sll1717 family n=1 Tax=Ruminococcus sp. TaxID=41978 RepID=UPI0025F2AD51|nr:hypothetical protein [Ruminococcus sp.]MCI6616862.1 hypothetical protein [Ruminococcus sp.]
MDYDNKFLLICKECGNPFFTKEERDLFVSKNYTFPERCKECNKSILNINKEKLYDEIINNWSIEAKKENSAYFYNVSEVKDIMNGSKSFVIGRKGSGKTSIAQHLYDLEGGDIFCQKLSFKNFPFKILYSLENQKEYTEPNQYISIWKFLIYSYICKKMITNNNINEKIRAKLGKLYGESTIKSLNKLIGKWTSKEFGIEILGSGLNYGGERQETEVSWIDSIEILESVIIEYCDSSYYYIIFDELDEDYKDFSNDEEATRYKCMLTSLFKAVQDIRSIFDNVEKKIYPIVFLRSDIYSQLTDSDKNKWRESVIDMAWDTNQIKQMLAHRLCVAMNIPDEHFDVVWYKVFQKTNVRMGNNKGRKMPIFSYIERSTEMRPRDFVQYVKECAILAKERNEDKISPKTVKDADETFSEYLKDETIDELFSVIPEINEILGLLSTIRKQGFQFSTFEKEYNILVEQGKIPDRDVKWILLKLFDAGVIGNQPTMKGQAIFRFSKKSPRFNFNEPMLIHRGLFKALQIF